MEKMRNYVNKKCIDAMIKWNDFKTTERGDTNFLSILIILIIVVGFAGVFIALGGNVQGKVEQVVTEFLNGL